MGEPPAPDGEQMASESEERRTIVFHASMTPSVIRRVSKR
jgi:hypothetical protein